MFPYKGEWTHIKTMFPWKGNENPREVIDEKHITREREGNPFSHVNLDTLNYTKNSFFNIHAIFHLQFISQSIKANQYAFSYKSFQQLKSC